MSTRNRSGCRNGAKPIQTHLSAPMLPVYDAVVVSCRELRRLPCQHDTACLNYVAKVHPNAFGAECPKACPMHLPTNRTTQLYDASRSGLASC